VRITSALVDPALLDLPWSTPLVEWPAQHLVALPQGISRHVVRFVRLGGYVYAVKETGERVAEREYDLLRALERIDFPTVEAVAIVADRQTDTGEPLDPVLITRHLQFSLPYRALFSHTLRPETMQRLLDALAALLVRMHLLLGRLFVVEHAVPAGRGGVRGLPGGRGDRRAAPLVVERAARRGSGDRPGEHLR